MALPKITDGQLKEWSDLDEKRLTLNRDSAAIAKRQSLLTDHFKTCLESAGKSSVKRGDYRVLLKEGRATVKWKDHLIDQIGPLEVGAIADAAPMTTRVVVERVA